MESVNHLNLCSPSLVVEYEFFAYSWCYLIDASVSVSVTFKITCFVKIICFRLEYINAWEGLPTNTMKIKESQILMIPR